MYSAALQFEGMLVQQITRADVPEHARRPSGGDDSTTGGDSGGIGAGPYQSMLPRRCPTRSPSGGGLGLAPELYRSMSLRLGLGPGGARPGVSVSDRPVEHLERQLGVLAAPAQIVLAQGEAIRAQDVEAVLARLGDVQAEMVEARPARARARRPAARRPPAQLGDAGRRPRRCESLVVLLPADERSARARCRAELQGLLSEIPHVHAQNRILIRQELAFLDHLMRVDLRRAAGRLLARPAGPPRRSPPT